MFQLSQLGERPEAGSHPPTPVQVEALARMMAAPFITCLVAEADGRVAGTATLYVLPGVGHEGRPLGVVENVVVDERTQGTGVGRELMDEVERRARERGCYKIAFTSNRKRVEAHAFYEHLGFTATHQGFSKYFD